MTYKLSLFCCLLIGFACTSSHEQNGEESTNKPIDNQPNILLILTDDQGYHDVSYYGTTDLSTPHIDALAADGMRFTPSS